MVRMKGLEPSRLSATASKTVVSAIPPHPHNLVGNIGFEPIQSETTDLQSGPALQLRRLPNKLF